MANLINIGVTGLIAHQAALGTTGNNITNANVPGYSRQRVELVNQPEQYLGVGYIGAGVRVDGVKRIVEQFAINQLRTDTSNYFGIAVQTSLYSQLDSLLADKSTGIAPTIESLFASLQQSASDPTSLPIRQVVLSQAGGVAQRFNSLYDQLQKQSLAVNEQLDSLTAQVTSLAQSIAKLNQDIATASGSSPNSQPNALLDKRDELVRQLSELVAVQVIPESTGMLNVYVGSGQPLVVGNRASTLTTAPSSADSSRREVLLSSGTSGQEIGSFLTGGTIGGLLSYRRNSLDTAFNTLGQIALNIADTLNQQQRLGLDLNGNFGNNLFTDINAVAAMQTRVLPNSTNPTSPPPAMGVYISDVGALTTSDYRLDFTSATGYTLTRSSDGAQTSGTLTLPLPGTITSADGFEIRIAAGSFQAGDRFQIQPTRRGAETVGVALQNPAQLAFAQPVRTAGNSANTGGGAISAGSMLAVYQANGTTLQSTFATAGALTPPLLIRFTSATTFDVLDNTNPAAPVAIPALTGQTFVPGQDNTVTINDPVSGDPVYSFNLSGNPASGDTFSVAYNSNGSSDNRNALALAGLRLYDSIGGRSTFEEAYGQLVAEVGSRTAQFKVSQDAAETLLTQSQANRDAVSGVNLDEEAANLIMFQQAYNASAQVISIARSLFDSLLAAVR